jgi:hypothetical protein
MNAAGVIKGLADLVRVMDTFLQQFALCTCSTTNRDMESMVRVGVQTTGPLSHLRRCFSGGNTYTASKNR